MTQFAKTRGHMATEPGLRGHSVDETTWPWRVVGGHWKRRPGGPAGLLACWTVEGVDCKTVATFRVRIDPVGRVIRSDDEACDAAHDFARRLKRQFPTGLIPKDRNYGGSPTTVGERLAGCVVLIGKPRCPLYRYLVGGPAPSHSGPYVWVNRLEWGARDGAYLLGAPRYFSAEDLLDPERRGWRLYIESLTFDPHKGHNHG